MAPSKWYNQECTWMYMVMTSYWVMIPFNIDANICKWLNDNIGIFTTTYLCTYAFADWRLVGIRRTVLELHLRLTAMFPGFHDIYPLVNIQKAIENDHRNSGFTH
jgi:hypothetical protein